MSALNWMRERRLALVGIGVGPREQRGGHVLVRSPVFAPAAVVGGVAGAAGAGGVAGAGAAVVAVCGLGVSLVGVRRRRMPARVSGMSVPSAAEQPSIRIVSPPGRGMGKRRRILTDDPQPVNVRAGVLGRVVALALLLIALPPRGARRADARRPPDPRGPRGFPRSPARARPRPTSRPWSIAWSPTTRRCPRDGCASCRTSAVRW